MNNYQKAINEETYGHISTLEGEERQTAILEAERLLAYEYAEGLEETKLEGYSMEELNEMYRNSLAAIHGVDASEIAKNKEGYSFTMANSIHRFNNDFQRLN